MKYDNLLFNIYYLVLTLSLFYTEVFQRWKKSVAAVALSVLIFHSCANFWFFAGAFLKIFVFSVQFLAFLLIFAWFLYFLAHVLGANCSGSKFCLCCFVSFFHLWSLPTPRLLSLNVVTNGAVSLSIWINAFQRIIFFLK